MPGLNLAEWTTRPQRPDLANEVTSDAQAANNEGFTGTPSFLIGKTGGAMQKLEPGSTPKPRRIEAAIEKLLKS